MNHSHVAHTRFHRRNEFKEIVGPTWKYSHLGARTILFDFDDTLPPHRPLPLVFVLRRTFSHQQSLADERLEHNVGLVCFNSSFDSEIACAYVSAWLPLWLHRSRRQSFSCWAHISSFITGTFVCPFPPWLPLRQIHSDAVILFGHGDKHMHFVQSLIHSWCMEGERQGIFHTRLNLKHEHTTAYTLWNVNTNMFTFGW